MNLNIDYLVKLSSEITPGPWKMIDGWDENEVGKYFPSIILDDSSSRSIVVNESHDHEIKSIMANAHLIAGAPELLAEVITLNKHNEAAQKTINRLSLEQAYCKAQVEELQKIITDAPVGVETNGERVSAWLKKAHAALEGK